MEVWFTCLALYPSPSLLPSLHHKQHLSSDPSFYFSHQSTAVIVDQVLPIDHGSDFCRGNGTCA